MDSWEHLEHFRKIIQAHAQARIKIKPKKTKIFQSEVEYLGRKVSQDEGRFAGYYRGFIPRYSALTNHMNLIKKAEKFEWYDDMKRDFKELKAEFLDQF